jgi:tetratricopeptide (TPR) repeat protein
MDGVNLPSLSNDWFATAIISIVSAVAAGLSLQVIENKITGSKLVNFLIATVLLAFTVVLVWYNVIGIVFFGLGRLIENTQGCGSALSVYRNAVIQNPKFIPARWGLVECGIRIKRLNEVLNTLEPLQVSLSDSHSYWQGLALIYYEVGNYSKMLSAVEQAADLNPKDSVWMTFLGEQLHRKLRYADAEAVLRVVRTHNGADGDAVFWLAWALYEQGKYQDAIGHFDMCMKLNPSGYNMARCMSGKGFALHRLGRYGEAKSLWETSLSLYPNQPDVRTALNQLP